MKRIRIYGLTSHLEIIKNYLMQTEIAKAIFHKIKLLDQTLCCINLLDQIRCRINEFSITFIVPNTHKDCK